MVSLRRARARRASSSSALDAARVDRARVRRVARRVRAATTATRAMTTSNPMTTTRMTTTTTTRWRARRRRRRDGRVAIANDPPSASRGATTRAATRTAAKKRDGAERARAGDALRGLWREIKYKPLREDESIEAVALMAALELARRAPEPGETWTREREEMRARARASIPSAVGAYWRARSEALIESQAVRDAAPLMSSAVNVAIAGVVLRLFLPRVAALQAVGGFDELTEFFGLPPRSELSGYLDQLRALPTAAVFAVYVGLFVAEKLTMTDEFLPIGFVLPVVSPVVFGGVFGGTMVTSLASTLAASVNFFLARYVLKDKILGFKWGESEPVGEQKWFAALSRRFDSSQFPESTVPEGFKSALLLRLCPILPIPISGNWYVCGLTPLKFKEFFAAHFIGSSKTAFIDAYLGSILLTAVFDESSVKDQAQGALVFETVAIMVVSILVSTYATELFTQILDEEGVDAGAMMGFGSESKDEDEDEDAVDATVAFIAAAALPVEPAGSTATSDDEPKADDDESDEDATSSEPELIPIERMPEDEKVLIAEGEALWRRAARVEAERQKLTIEEMTDYDSMGPDM